MNSHTAAFLYGPTSVFNSSMVPLVVKILYLSGVLLPSSKVRSMNGLALTIVRDFVTTGRGGRELFWHWKDFDLENLDL